LNGAKNAGILAAQIVATYDANIAAKLSDYKKLLEAQVMEMVKRVK
jgi:5-(carboxyamino)imidazole ribonucleotide mutase